MAEWYVFGLIMLYLDLVCTWWTLIEEIIGAEDLGTEEGKRRNIIKLSGRGLVKGIIVRGITWEEERGYRMMHRKRWVWCGRSR